VTTGMSADYIPFPDENSSFSLFRPPTPSSSFSNVPPPSSPRPPPRPPLLKSSSSAVHQMKSSVQHLLTSTSLNEVFSTRYRRQALFALLAYFSVGIGYYCGQEGFTFLDALYFIVITVLTIGYGDYIPNSTAQRLFTCFFIVFGVLIVSACIGSVTEVLYDIHERLVHERVSKAAARMKIVENEDSDSNIIDFLDVSHKRSVEDVGGREGEGIRYPSSPLADTSPLGGKVYINLLILSPRPPRPPRHRDTHPPPSPTWSRAWMGLVCLERG
jgi:hypothetical protein